MCDFLDRLILDGLPRGGPASLGAYLPVEDLPAKRDKPAMSTDEQAKLRKELTAARDRQTSRVKAREGEPRKP